MIALSIGGIALIRSQPRDDDALRAFLSPPAGCPVPCFIGIRPGETTLEDAVAILSTHDWVDDVEVKDGGMVRWHWAETNPGWLDTSADNWIRTDDGRVVYVGVATRVTMGDLWLALDQPLHGVVVGGLEGGEPFAFFLGVYYERRVMVSAGGACPLHPPWGAFTYMRLQEDYERHLTDWGQHEHPNHLYSMCRLVMGQ
jgi:hypothetical protein